jgi:hypothetical protein
LKFCGARDEGRRKGKEEGKGGRERRKGKEEGRKVVCCFVDDSTTRLSFSFRR